MHLVGRVKPDKIVDNAICFWCGRKIVWLKFLVLKVFLNLSLSIARKKIEFLVNLSGISTEIHENASNGRLKSKGCDRLENFEAKSLEYQSNSRYLLLFRILWALFSTICNDNLIVLTSFKALFRWEQIRYQTSTTSVRKI